MIRGASEVCIALLATLIACPATASAQVQIPSEKVGTCCRPTDPRVVWTGSRREMTLARLAAYAAPILWFSPDEPLLAGEKRPGRITIPEAFPFQPPGAGPVAYFRVRRIFHTGSAKAYTPNPRSRADALIDLAATASVEIDYFFYYPRETGFGGHKYDVESVEMNLLVIKHPDCATCPYSLAVTRVNAKAHGVSWYDNTLVTDKQTRFPITILVEEGKHASCTDKNGDGSYTPGYDVNRRVNDAWGVRDTIGASALLFSGAWHSWFQKIRKPQDRVFPPLPADSIPRQRLAKQDGSYAPGYRKYTLRPYPRLAEAKAYSDPRIVPFVDKGHDDWPELKEAGTEEEEIRRWIGPEGFTKSVSLALRVDDGLGFSVLFPLFIVKNFNEPFSHGWLVNRIYLQDTDLRDFGWDVVYTQSASRWLDGYVSAGLEVDTDDVPGGGVSIPSGGTVTHTYFAAETGIKFRFDVGRLPLGFIKKVTSFWGLRIGIKYLGATNIEQLGWIVEFGAGTF